MRSFYSAVLATAMLSLAFSGLGHSQEPKTEPPEPPEPVDTSKPRLIVQTGHTSEVHSVAFSPDSRSILSSDNYSTRLWDAQTGKELLTLAPAKSIAFSRDGKQILAATWKRVDLWDARTGKMIQHTVLGQLGSVLSAALSPNGERILTGGVEGAKLWDASSAKLLQPFGDKLAKVHAVAISPDGTRLLIGFEDHTQLWDADSGKLLFTLVNSKSTLAVAFSPKGRRLLTASGTSARIWDAENGRELHWLTGHTQTLRAVAFSPDGKRVLTGSEDNTAKLWDEKTGKELQVLKGHTSHVTSVAFSPDGKFIVTGSKDETVRIWDAQTGQKIRILKGTGRAHQTVVFSHDGSRILICSKVTSARLWDARTGAEMFALSGHTGVVTSGCFSLDGNRVLTGSADKTARIWDAQTGKELLVLNGHTERVRSVAFSPDGSRVLTGSDDKTARVWDAQSGQELLTIKKHDGAVTSVAFSPKGKQLLTGSDGKSAKIWDAQTGKVVRVLDGDTENFQSVAFSPDGTRILTAGLSRLLVWNARTGNSQLSYTFTTNVTAAAFSPDGKRILKSGNRMANLVDAEANNQIAVLHGNYGVVTSVCFSGDGKYILTGCEDNLTRVYDSQTGKVLCKLISFGDGNWAVADAAGRYDASKGGDVEGMHWVVNMEPIALSQLKERYYDPGLLAKYLGFNKQPLRQVAAFEGVKLFPYITIAQKKMEQPKLDVTLTNRGGGIGRVVVLINGKELTPDARPRDANPDAATLSIPVDLTGDPRVVPGKKNRVEVRAYNAEGYLVSRGAEYDFEAAGTVPPAEKPTVYGVVVGVSKYRGKELNLRYAAKDAEDFSKALRLAASRLFDDPKKLPATRVNLTLLNAEDGTGRPSRANITKALESLKATKPGDLVVVYLAGHGVTHGGQDGDWYYLTADAQSGNLSDPGVRKQVSLSSAELTDLLKTVPAQKQVLILDTCHAGLVNEKLTEKRDVPGSQVRALERVKDRTGMHVLAGCAADSVSYEASRYGQGLLTYSLLFGMRGAKLREGEFVDVVELFGFAADKVPELARDIGGIQRPTVSSPRGGSFDIGQLTAADRAVVPLQDEKPILVRSGLQLEKEPLDSLGLSSRVNAWLGELASKPRDARLVFVDTAEFPGALQANGRYSVVGDKVEVNVSLYLSGKKVQEFKVLGRVAKRDDLAREIATEIEKRAAASAWK
jgi:WD40 repeat protein